MSNIRTLKDYEDGGPTSAPFPDAWKTHPQRHSVSPSEFKSLRSGQQNQGGISVQFQYIALDGNKETYQVNGTPPAGKMCCLVCCPCFVPPLCSVEKQRQWRNFVKSFSFIISAIQIILLIVALGLGGFETPSLNPSLGPPSDTLLLLGAKLGSPMKKGEVWRFITPIFLHAGIIHIFFNIFSQLRFGLALERRWGLIKFISLYFISGIGGSLMSVLVRPNAVGVGASGAIMGLMGGFLSEVIMTWNKTSPIIRRINLFQAIFVIVITMILSSIPFVDAGAHFGGVLIGYLMGNLFFSIEHDKYQVRRGVPIISGIAMAIFFGVGLGCFYGGVVNVATQQ